MLTLISLVSAFNYDSRSFYITGDRFPYRPLSPFPTTRVLVVPFYKNEEREIKKEKKKGFWNRIGEYTKDYTSGVSVLKVAIIIIVFFVAIAIGYQIRKSEEQSNYVRLPAAAG